VGRGTRPAPGKTRMILLDFVDATLRHKLVTVAALAGLGADLPNGSRVSRALARQAADADTWAAFVAAVAPAFAAERVRDLWDAVAAWRGAAEPPAGDWREFADDVEDLAGPGAPLTDAQRVALVGFGWPADEAARLTRRQARWAIQRHMALSDAAAAERARLWQTLLDAPVSFDAPWTRRPASPKQLALLRRLGAPDPPWPLLAGEASAVIDHLMAARAAR
jgi:hypothetical protein